MGLSKVQMRRIASDFESGRLPALNSQQFIVSTMGERSLQLEVIALFQAQLATVANRDLKSDVKFMAHTLRGAALALGADEIAAIALLLEDQKCSSTELAAHLEQATARFNTAVHRILQIS